MDKEAILKQGAHRADIYTRNPQTEATDKFVYEMKPGDTIQDELWFVNRDNEENTLLLYPVFLYLNEKDTKAANLRTEEKKEIAEWLTFDETTEEDTHEIVLALEPQERRIVPFSITIPADTPEGFYEGGFAMERTVAGTPGSGVNNVFRKVFKIEITVNQNPKEFVVKNLNFADQTDNSLFANVLALKPEIFLISGSITTLLIVIISIFYFRNRKKSHKI